MSRRRSSRALTNDAAIREASVELILSVGIDAISFRDVGKVAGLTHGALYARFEDVEELLVDLWNEVLSHRAIAIFEAARYAARNPSEASVDSLLDFVRNAEPTDVAAIQVLFLSRRFDVLFEEVETFVHNYLEAPNDDSGAVRARTLALFSLISAKIFSNSEFGLNTDRVKFLGPVLVATLQTDPEDVLSVPLSEPNDRLIPAPNNDLRSQLAYYTFSAVGRSGYTRATISRISRRANCSPGAIYKIYPSKEDLVIDATRGLMQAPWISLASAAAILNEGMLAQLLYAAASEQNALRRNFILEMMMASAHNAKLRSAVGAQLQVIESVAPRIVGISDEERKHFEYMLREIVLLVLGVSFLSAITGAVSQMDFNQFAEPFRQSLIDCCFPSWAEISRQLKEMAATWPRQSGLS
ncbi:MAG TPA: TetR/AcrR family transcriptional regulator [Acidimicrobiales bacterium]|nr:TetR/AcrR family transcriptional regulator [Acidimicrobiales bacterium]